MTDDEDLDDIIAQQQAHLDAEGDRIADPLGLEKGAENG